MTEKEILLSSILNCPRSSLYAGDFFLDPETLEKLSRYLSLRSQGFPLQYILGEIEFFGLIFKLDKRVFIPRPETEILVETAINKLKAQKGGLRILDLGTGSGCIALSLAKFLPSARITATDVSSDALCIAGENARLNNLDRKIEFIQSDLFENLALSLGKESLPSRKGGANNLLKSGSYDMIISNPPYICSGDIEYLQKELSFEPRLALDGGSDGLVFYRRIIKKADAFLRKKGLLLIEMGFGQYNKIKNLLQRSHNFEIMNIVKDYSNIERIMVARLKR